MHVENAVLFYLWSLKLVEELKEEKKAEKVNVFLAFFDFVW